MVIPVPNRPEYDGRVDPPEGHRDQIRIDLQTGEVGHCRFGPGQISTIPGDEWDEHIAWHLMGREDYRGVELMLPSRCSMDQACQAVERQLDNPDWRDWIRSLLEDDDDSALVVMLHFLGDVEPRQLPVEELPVEWRLRIFEGRTTL